MTEKKTSSVFISHGSKDGDFVRWLVAELERHGIDTWVDHHQLRPGDSLYVTISDGLAKADRFIIVLSEASITSPWVNRELYAALNRETREGRPIIIPLILEQVIIPTFIEDRKYADFSDPDNRVEALKELIGAFGVEFRETKEGVKTGAPLHPDQSSPDLSSVTEVPDPHSNNIPGPDGRKLAIVGISVIVLIMGIVAFSLRSWSDGGNSVDPNTNRSTPYLSETPNTSNPDHRIGYTGRLTRDMVLRETPGGLDSIRKIGVHYQGARVKILDVQPAVDTKGNTFGWYKVQITAYGVSMDPKKGNQGKDPGSSDVGWIHSYPNISQNNTVQRVNSVQFDN
jgi:hypothetical protein